MALVKWTLQFSAVMISSNAAIVTAVAQTGGETLPRWTLQAPGTNAASTVHRNAIGRPCLEYEAVSRAHTSNPDIFDNVVSVRNHCAKRIYVSVCYLNTPSCTSVELPPFQRRDAVLGVRPKSQYFRYSYQEKKIVKASVLFGSLAARSELLKLAGAVA